MPLALLLSPDDQAVSAITTVLEEMVVSCERPLDGISAAKKLNSHNFDLVLVDCENLPAAKLIFDVCRRGKSGKNPVPIAIVDGRAGLPTAFRLGAELILTKPVAKDQARSTIRTAVSRLKKEEPPRPAQPAAPTDAGQADAVQASSPQASDETEALLTHYETSTEAAGNAMPEPRAQAATAAAGSSALPSLSQSASAAPAPAPMSSPAPARPALDALPAANTGPKPAEPQPAPVMKPSNDPVLADIEEAEANPRAPVLSPPQQKQRKARKSLVALLVLVLAAGGFYAAWMYQPDFRALVQPAVDNVLSLVGIEYQSHDQAPAGVPARPGTRPTPATAANSAQSQPTAATASATTSKSTPGAAAAKPAPSTTFSATASPTAAVVSKSGAMPTDAYKPAANSNVPSQNSSATNSTGTANISSAELPGEKTAVILSSQAAEKRLAHSLQPIYPAEAASTGAEGTVVLKALIDETGRVAGARVIEGNGALASAAINAVKQWRYRPYVRDGKALPFQTIVLVDFQRP